MSIERASSASSPGATIAPTAATRNRSRRPLIPAGRAPGRRGQMSWLIVPASETSRPLEVDRNAANAPAAVSAPRIVPAAPGQATSGRRSTMVSVWPVR